nr:hypothetical protein [Halalkalicoccus paucihalophilus]
MELLEAAVDVREEEEFRLYKEFEPQKVRQALDHISWRAPLPQVAGEMMSNLILRHSLPNASHRTGIAMLQFCIESVNPDFEMPRTHFNDETWQSGLIPISSSRSASSLFAETSFESSSCKSWVSIAWSEKMGFKFS